MSPLQPQTQEFLSARPLLHFINGEWTKPHSQASITTTSPGDGTFLAELAAGDEADVDSAVAAADLAFRHSGWATLKANERAVILYRLADLVDRNAATLAELESLDVGKPRGAAAGDVQQLAKTIRFYADLSVSTRLREPIPVAGYEARQVRVPYGVCAFILPWNFPLLLLGWGIAPALAAGNTIVVKPPEDASLSTLFFCRLTVEAGIPKGVVNVITGLGEVTGAALAAHPGIKRMSFTGSPEVGRLIAESCGRNLVPVKLELGGKGAAVVFDDVDLDATAQALAGAITFNTGQVCCTATRWLVQEGVYSQFIEKVSQKLERVKIGYGLDEGTDMGPLISEKQRNRVLSYLSRGQEQGARVIVAGGATKVAGHERGYYVKPALIEGTPANVCAREEIFGPAAFVMPFKTEDQAVTLVNSSAYGLGNSVWSKNLERAGRVAESLVAGTNWINCHNAVLLGVPYAGCNLSGMGGGVLGPDTYFDYLRPFSVIRPTG